jgi:hypothetical protein
LRKLIVAVVVVGCMGTEAWAQVPGAVRQTAMARIGLAQTVAADPQVLKAVVAKNSTHETMEEILHIDKEWTDNLQYPLRKTLSMNACAQHLRELTKDDPLIVEVILMDAQGANVCVSKETSDYWQGDEAKWQKTFGASKEVFIDEPAFDASTGVYAIQLSAIVADGKTKVGALTFTLRLHREDVGKPGSPSAGGPPGAPSAGAKPHP